MDEEKLNDFKIKQYLKKDKIISKRVNATFDNFINELRNEELEEVPEIPKIQNIQQVEQTQKIQENNIQNQKVQEFPKKNNSFRKFASLVASLVIVVFTSNAYATTKGYDNIFFMIKEIYIEATNPKVEFSDREIIISYKPIYITDSIQMQINKLQAKDNEATLYLKIKETNTNYIVPLKYKITDNNGKVLFDGVSSKPDNEREYDDNLKLSNFSDDVSVMNMEVYDNTGILIKSIEIDLDYQTIEAKSENEQARKLSQIELNKFIKEEIIKSLEDDEEDIDDKENISNKILNTKNEVKSDLSKKSKKEENKQDVLVLKIVDITYYNYTYIVQFLYSLPTEEDYENETVEDLPIYQNIIKFNIEDDEFNLIELDEAEKFEN